MRNLVLRMSMTLDSFVSGPNGEMDWFLKTRSEDGAASVAERIGQASAHLMGRKTFTEMASFWPTAGGVLAKPMNDIPKIVFSKSGASLTSSFPASAKSWAEAKVLTGDMSDEIAKLKKQDGGNLVAHGGVSFAQSLLQTGLVDELWITRHPVAIGKGRDLFSQLKSPLYFQLVDTKISSAGTTGQVYRPVR